MVKSIPPFKDILRLDFISEGKKTHYFRICFLNNTIGLYNNEFTLIKIIRGE
jgi:hypothetical protein